MDKMPCPDTFPDIISVRSFISKQFPTLLAIREIIADAMFNPQCHTGTSTEARWIMAVKAATTPAYAVLLRKEDSNVSRRLADT